METILDAIRVVEMTEALAGPYCAMLLGDFGADVIKVERPAAGDQSRGWGPPFAGSESAYFLAANRNKRSITLNYNHPRGSEALQKLLASADVFIINQPSLASLQKRGIDPDSLCAKYPRMIYCGITGYGLTGPKAGMPGYDILAQAEAGVMSFTGEAGGGPMRYPIAIADMTCGMYAAMGILAALLAREKTGRGQFIDMALFDSQLTWLANAGSSYLNAGVSPERWGNAHPNIVPYEMYRGGNEKYFVVGVGTEALWKRFVRVMNAEDSIGRDERFTSNVDGLAHRHLLAVDEGRDVPRRDDREDFRHNVVVILLDHIKDALELRTNLGALISRLPLSVLLKDNLPGSAGDRSEAHQRQHILITGIKATALICQLLLARFSEQRMRVRQIRETARSVVDAR